MTQIFLFFNEFHICVIGSNQCNQRFLDFLRNLLFKNLTRIETIVILGYEQGR